MYGKIISLVLTGMLALTGCSNKPEVKFLETDTGQEVKYLHLKGMTLEEYNSSYENKESIVRVDGTVIEPLSMHFYLEYEGEKLSVLNLSGVRLEEGANVKIYGEIDNSGMSDFICQYVEY